MCVPALAQGLKLWIKYLLVMIGCSFLVCHVQKCKLWLKMLIFIQENRECTYLWIKAVCKCRELHSFAKSLASPISDSHA